MVGTNIYTYNTPVQYYSRIVWSLQWPDEEWPIYFVICITHSYSTHSGLVTCYYGLLFSLLSADYVHYNSVRLRWQPARWLLVRARTVAYSPCRIIYFWCSFSRHHIIIIIPPTTTTRVGQPCNNIHIGCTRYNIIRLEYNIIFSGHVASTYLVGVARHISYALLHASSSSYIKFLYFYVYFLKFKSLFFNILVIIIIII